ELQGVLAVIDDHEHSGNRLEEFEHGVLRNREVPAPGVLRRTGHLILGRSADQGEIHPQMTQIDVDRQPVRMSATATGGGRARGAAPASIAIESPTAPSTTTATPTPAGHQGVAPIFLRSPCRVVRINVLAGCRLV